MAKKSFTIIELLLVIAIIGLIASIIVIATAGARAQTRDTKRKAETDSIRKAIEMYYADYDQYPIETEWTKLEEDTELQNALSKYLPTIPKDPLYGKTKDTGEPFSYQYKSNPEGTEYKIHVEVETGTYASYEQASSGGWTEIVYGGGGTFSGQVSTGLDDAYDDGTNFYTTSTGIWLGNNGTYINNAGFRFQSVTVPQGITITSARMQLRRYNLTTQIYTTIYGVDAGDTTSWSSSNNPKDATITSSGVNWDPGAEWTDWTYTPDLTNVVQEIVCRSDWASGNAVSFVIWQRLVGPGTRSARAYEYNPADATKLEINYSGTAYGNCAAFANAPPTAPTTLYVGYPSAQSGTSNPTDFAYSTPVFSAIYNDPDVGDTANKYRVQITLSSDTDYMSPVWDSGSAGTSFSATCDNGTRCEDIPYTGITLLNRGQNYIWRIKFWDSAANEGTWSSNGTIGMGSGALTARFYIVDRTIEGCLFDNSPTWDVRHDSTGSGVCNLTSITTQIGDNSSITRLSRSFFPFDTSGIPDTDTIIASSLKLWASGVVNNDNDGNDFLSVFKSYQASPTALQVSDYDKCGDSIGYAPSGPYPTEGSDRIDLNNISTSQYTSFTFNATGTSWVSPTGRTLLCVREGHDSRDDVPAGSVYTDIYTADYGIMDRRPCLEVTYQ